MKIAASILAADFGRLGEQLRELEATGQIDRIHIDVMDGLFVPNISVGLPVVEAVGRYTNLPISAHLMITAPDRYIGRFAGAGARYITVHYEACPHLERDIALIKQYGCQAGVALNPPTPVEVLESVLGGVDLALLMSVQPGFSGQPFIPETLEKIKRLRGMLEERGLGIEIAVDGGLNPDTAPAVLAAGADVLAVGAALFNRSTIAEAVRALVERCRDQGQGPRG